MAANPGLAEEACKLEPGPTHSVARVLDSETLLLDDGSEVRLIGALAPHLAGQDLDGPREREARRLIEEMVAGRDVELKPAGRKHDRYGRHLARSTSWLAASGSGCRAGCSRRDMRAPTRPQATRRAWGSFWLKSGQRE